MAVALTTLEPVEISKMANDRIPPFDPPSTWPSFWLGYRSGLCTGIGLTLIALVAIVVR
jgi:hypothetical protein